MPKDFEELTNEERQEIFKLLRPIGTKPGDIIHQCEIRHGEVLEINQEVAEDVT